MHLGISELPLLPGFNLGNITLISILKHIKANPTGNFTIMTIMLVYIFLYNGSICLISWKIKKLITT